MQLKVWISQYLRGKKQINDMIHNIMMFVCPPGLMLIVHFLSLSYGTDQMFSGHPVVWLTLHGRVYTFDSNQGIQQVFAIDLHSWESLPLI